MEVSHSINSFIIEHEIDIYYFLTLVFKPKVFAELEKAKEEEEEEKKLSEKVAVVRSLSDVEIDGKLQEIDGEIEPAVIMATTQKDDESSSNSDSRSISYETPSTADIERNDNNDDESFESTRL